MQKHTDEILQKAVSSDATAVPRYNLKRPDGSFVEKNVALELANAIAQAGTPINKTVLDEFLAASGVTAGTATAYTLAQAGYAIFDGAPVRFRLHAASGEGATLNINGTGAKPIVGAMGKPMPGGIPAGTWLTANYSAAAGAYILAGGENLEHIEDVLGGERYVVDDSVAYIKDVPADTLTHAEVGEIGGMTRKCTNLIPFPYTSASQTIQGVTFTFNEDGSVTAIGTAEDYVQLQLTSGVVLPNGQYYLSGCPSGGSEKYALRAWVQDNVTFKAVDEGGGVTFTFDESVDKNIGVYAHIEKGVTVNIVFKPMLNYGTEPLPYEPYFEGLRSAAVTEVESVGANLVKWLGLKQQTVIRNGVTITTNDDGTITLNGTATATFWPDYTASGFPNTDWEKYDNAMPIPEDFYTLTTKTIRGSRQTSDEHLLALGSYTHDRRNIVATVGQDSSSTTSEKFARFNSIYTSIINGDTYNNYTFAVQIQRGRVATDIVEPTVSTLPIPEAVRALDGYGWGINDEVYNYIDWKNKRFVKRVEKIVLDGTESILDFNSVSHRVQYNTEIWGKAANSTLSVLCADYTTIADGIDSICIYEETTVRLLIRDSNIGNTITTASAWGAYLAERYAAGNPLIIYYELATPIITDISALLPADNILRVEPGGTVTAVSEYSYAVPSTITYERNVLANRASTLALEKLRLALELLASIDEVTPAISAAIAEAIAPLATTAALNAAVAPLATTAALNAAVAPLAKANLSNASGTFGGAVKANTSAVSSLGTAQVRNVTISATDLTAGSSALATGDSYHVYA